MSVQDPVIKLSPYGIAVKALRRLAEGDYNPDLPGQQTFEIAGRALAEAEELSLENAAAQLQARREAVQYALVEQFGHRATVATVRETTFLGEPMLGVTDLETGSEHLVSPKSIYEVSWLTEDEARSRVKPWTAVALPAADPWGVSHSDTDDEDSEEPGDGKGCGCYRGANPHAHDSDEDGDCTVCGCGQHIAPDEAADDQDDEYRQAGIDATPELYDHGGKERDYDAEGNEL